MIGKECVKLITHEQELFNAIEWDGNRLLRMSHADAIGMLEKVKQLAESLITREATPKIRMGYFTNPEMNIAGRGKSRKDNFERNGTVGEAIFSHPHFIPYLWYFINGVNLPDATVDGFRKIIDEDRGTSAMVQDQLCKFVRNEMKLRSLSYEAIDEFVKLVY